jgi:hypothetical protein
MSKESWKAVREVATVTAVGAVEGAVILGLVDPLRVGGAIVGGFLGGTTALAGELVGRIKKKDVTTVHKAVLSFQDTEHGQRHVVKTTAQETKRRVPWIQVPDTIATLHFKAWKKATGRLQTWSVATQIASHAPNKDAKILTHYVEKDPRPL